MNVCIYIYGMEYGVRSEVYCCMILRSIKQWVEPESTNASKGSLELKMLKEVSDRRNEFRSERADTLSLRISVAQCSVTQPSACAEKGGLHIIFCFFLGFRNLSGMGPSFAGRRRGLGAILGCVSSTSTEHAEFVVKTMLPFLQSQLAVFPQLISKRVRDRLGLVGLVIVAGGRTL